MKNLPLILILLFGFSLAQERVIIENNNGIYNVKVQNLPKSHQKHNKKHYKYKQHHSKKLKYYIASKNGKVFHKPDCKFAKRIKKKIKFKFRKEAKAYGLRPCKYCKP